MTDRTDTEQSSINFGQAGIGTIRYSVDPKDWFTMRHADWRRIRANTGTLANPLPYIGQIGWAAISLSASAFLALIPWTPAYSQLPSQAHYHYAWVTPSLFAAGISAFVIAGLSFLVSRMVRRRERFSLDLVLDDMDTCYRPNADSWEPPKPERGIRWGWFKAS